MRKFKLTLFSPFLLLILLFSSSPVNSEEKERSDTCIGTCECDQVLSPFLIECTGKSLKTLFSEDEWVDFATEVENTTVAGGDLLFNLRLKDNDLKKVTKFPSLPITSINFMYNNISEIEQFAFEELENLTSLNFCHNELTWKSLDEFVFAGSEVGKNNYKPLEQLSHLNLSHNFISFFHKDLFDHTPNLETLDISYNPLNTLSGDTAISLSYLKNLQVLKMDFIKISDIPEGLLHNLPKLVSLSMVGNLFTVVPPELKLTPQLQVLDLSKNKFSTFDSESFKNLENLEALTVSNINTLKSVQKETFGSLKKLKKLDMSFNRHLSEISDDAFLGLVTDETKENWPLTEILLNDNGLPYLDQFLVQWESVKYIDIQNNPFVCDCKIDWMATILLEYIKDSPLLQQNIVCSGPPEWKGTYLFALYSEPERFERCRKGARELDLPESMRRGGGYYDSDPYQVGGITALVIGIFLMVIALSILGVIIVKRRAIANALIVHQEIKYEKACTEEFDYESGHSSKIRGIPS